MTPCMTGMFMSRWMSTLKQHTPTPKGMQTNAHQRLAELMTESVSCSCAAVRLGALLGQALLQDLKS